MSGNIGSSIVFPASLAGVRRSAGGGEWISRSTRREVLIGNARKGVRWKVRVANLSPLAPQSGGADLRHLLCSHCRPTLYSRSPASLLGERSPLHSTLALQREESFKNPQKRKLLERWRRCIYSSAPQAQKELLLPGSRARGRPLWLICLAVRVADSDEAGVSSLRLRSKPWSSEGNT